MNPKLQLHIPTPCHENWNAMTPQAQGRFCNACAKVVVDFSMMTDKEVLDYMNTATSNVCGRMSTEQLAKPLQAYPATRSFGWKYMWSLLVGSFLMTAKSYAQGKVVAQKPKTTQLPPVIRMGAVAYTQPDKKSVPVKLEGVVVDENGQPISFASVIIKGTTKGTMANEKGFFSMPVSKINSNDNLMISAVGYEALHITVGSGIAEIKKDSSNEAYAILNFKMVTMKGQLLGEVVVCSYPVQGKLVSVAGGISVSRVRTLRKKIIDTIAAPFVNTQVKLYPNPVNRNSNFKIEFNIKEAGNYNIEFTDGSGKLIHRATVNLLYKNQLENFSGAIFSTTGVYYVKVTGSQNKKIPAAKILVQ
ncbi:MAG: hypothetical protein RLZZ316_1092 [Bacteroidota bacterium]|jgi:hypothetical protein